MLARGLAVLEFLQRVDHPSLPDKAVRQADPGRTFGRRVVATGEQGTTDLLGVGQRDLPQRPHTAEVYGLTLGHDAGVVAQSAPEFGARLAFWLIAPAVRSRPAGSQRAALAEADRHEHRLRLQPGAATGGARHLTV